MSGIFYRNPRKLNFFLGNYSGDGNEQNWTDALTIKSRTLYHENDIFDYLVEFRDDYLLTGFHLFEFDQGGGKANLYKPRLTEKGEIKLATYIQENSKLTKAKRKIVLSWKVVSCIVGIVTAIVTFLANYTTTIDNAILGFKNLLESIKELF